MSNTRFYVSHLKNIIFQFRHAFDTIGYGSDTCWTRLERLSDMTEHGLDTTRTKPSTFFFQLFDEQKKNSKARKPKFILGILFEVSIEIIPYIFWKRYRKYT